MSVTSFVLGGLVLISLVIGILIGAVATRSGYRHNPPAPPKPPGRHSRRPDGGPERRQDYGAEPMPPLRRSWAEEPQEGPRTPSGAGSANAPAEAVTGPMRGAVWPLGGSPGPLVQPGTREMRAPRPSPGQDMARWRREQEQRGPDA